MSTFCARCGKPVPTGMQECPCTIDALEIEGLEARPAKRPSGGRSAPVVSPAADVDFGDDFEAGSSISSSSPSSSGSSALFGAELDLETDDVGPSLELETDRPMRHSAPAASPERRPSVPPASARPSGAPATDLVRASGPGTALVDAARKLAAYGECTGALQAPMYALRVRGRHKELKAEVKRLGEALLGAEGEAEEAMARIGTCIRDAAAHDGTLAPMVEAVVRAEAQAKDRELAVIAADTSSAVLSDVVKQRIAQVKERIAPSRAEIERILPDFRARQEAHRRVMAQVRRSEIELRNLKDLANAKDTEASAQTDPARKAALASQAAELRGRTPEYESVLASQRATAAEMEGPIADLERTMAQHRRTLAEGEGEIAKLQMGQQKEAAALDRAKEERMQILAGARVTVRNRLADLARKAIAQRFQVEAISPMIPQAQTLAAKADAVRNDLELYRTALEVHDRGRVQQGWLILGGSAASVLLVLGLIVGSC